MTAAVGPLAQRILLAGGSALVGYARTVAALLDWHEHNGAPRRHVWPPLIIMGRQDKPRGLPPGFQGFHFVEPAHVLVDSFAPLPLAEVGQLFATLRIGDLEWSEAAGDPEVAELLAEANGELLAAHRPAFVSARAQAHNDRETERRQRHMRGVTYRCLYLRYPRFGGAA